MEDIQEDRSGGKQQLFEKCLFSQHKGRHENKKNAKRMKMVSFTLPPPPLLKEWKKMKYAKSEKFGLF